MNRTKYMKALASAVLGLLSFAGVLGNGAVICQAPGDHVALESALMAGRCQELGNSDRQSERGESTTLEASPTPCIDTPLSQSLLRALGKSDSQESVQLACSATTALLPVLAAFPPLALHVSAPVSQGGTVSLLRSVILRV